MSFEYAKRKLLIADHMLIMTYKQLKDPKLLVAVLDNLYQTVISALKELLLKEREYKRIPAYSDTPEGMLKIFRDKLVTRIGIKQELIREMTKIVELKHEQKSAPVEFARRKEFVIANKDYRLKTLNEEKLKISIKLIKEALELMERYTNVRGY